MCAKFLGKYVDWFWFMEFTSNLRHPAENMHKPTGSYKVETIAAFLLNSLEYFEQYIPLRVFHQSYLEVVGGGASCRVPTWLEWIFRKLAFWLWILPSFLRYAHLLISRYDLYWIFLFFLNVIFSNCSRGEWAE